MMDSTMGITNTEFCSHGQHMVKADKITWLELPGRGRRRICDDCKKKVEEVNKQLTDNKKTA